MVSSANPLATEAGLEVLADGGNAFDATVAVAAALGVAEPYMSGVGGYGAIVLYDAEAEEVRYLNASNRVPDSLDPGVFREPTPNHLENRRGAAAVTTPGSVNAWEALSEEYGELPWERLFEPAIAYAEEGVEIGPVTAGWISSEYADFPASAQRFYGNNGVPLQTGEVLVQDDLAKSLRLISEEGASVVYEGEIAEAVAAAVQQNGGFMTVEDLSRNEAEWRETLGMDYGGYEVRTSSPPTTAWDTLVRLGVMSRFDLASLGHNTAAHLNTYAQITEQAFRNRAEFASDPDVEETPLDLLLSEGYWEEQAANVESYRAASFDPPPTFTSSRGPGQGSASGREAATEHTTHFVVADREGNVVSATQTLGNVFGSRIMPEGTGIWLNDSIAFSRFEPEGNPLDVFPGRNRLVGISPMLLMRGGRPEVALGTPGGHTIVQTTPQIISNMTDFGLDVQNAISAPRVSFVEPDSLVVEAGISAPIRAELSALGNNILVETSPGLGNAHGLTVEYGESGEPVRFTGGSDPRGEGVAAGF